jgi:SAM-dependent methyltransferase
MNINEIAEIYSSSLIDNKRLFIVTDDDYQWLYIVRYLPLSRDSYIFDAGCGEGKYMRKILASGYSNVFGADLFDRHPEKGRYLRANIANVPIKDSSFDLVYSNSVIFYLPDPQKALEEFYRILKPGGTVIVTVHTKYSLFTLDRVIKRLLRLATVDHLSGVRFYSSMEYKRMFDNAGFEVAEIDGYKISYLLWPAMMKSYRLLGMENPNRVWKNSRLSRYLLNNIALLKWIKSIICYHAVLIGRKKI